MRLQESWHPRAPVRFLAPAANAEVLALCAENDVFVFPTRFEEFPVALLEAMSTGLVPVVSDLPSGVPEVVSEQTGFRIAIGKWKNRWLTRS
jgi:glycosyltransferase involved in cell wall biosynthesis